MSTRPKTERQLAVDDLEACGYEFSNSSNAQRLQYLLTRAEKGLISYEWSTPAGLRKFCEQRKLPVASGAKKADSIALLEEADENPEFKGFQDLPAELRVQIYETVIRDAKYDEKHDKRCSFLETRLLAQHPVTKCSRLLRKESLPVFYDMVHAPMDIATRRPDSSQFYEGPCVHFHPRTRNFFRNTPDTVISQFKKILLHTSTHTWKLVFAASYLRWEIRLPSKGKEGSIRCVLEDCWARGQAELHVVEESRVLKEATETLIRNILQEMAARGEDSGLRKQDVFELSRVCLETCRQLKKGSK